MDRMVNQISVSMEIIGNNFIEDDPRKPSYSETTIDILTTTSDIGRYLELCSISQRTDYVYGKVLEIAIGMDRCVHKFINKE